MKSTLQIKVTGNLWKLDDHGREVCKEPREVYLSLASDWSSSGKLGLVLTTSPEVILDVGYWWMTILSQRYTGGILAGIYAIILAMNKAFGLDKMLKAYASSHWLACELMRWAETTTSTFIRLLKRIGILFKQWHIGILLSVVFCLCPNWGMRFMAVALFIAWLCWCRVAAQKERAEQMEAEVAAEQVSETNFESGLTFGLGSMSFHTLV